MGSEHSLAKKNGNHGAPRATAWSRSARSRRYAGNSTAKIQRILRGELVAPEAIDSRGDAAECAADHLARSVLSSKGEAVSFGRASVATTGSLTSAGLPLSEEIRSDFEPRFGLSLDRVRLHTDPAAAKLAQGLNARAFTIGSHIAFAPGELTPHTTSGRELLAHELAHISLGQAGIQRKAATSDVGTATIVYEELVDFADATVEHLGEMLELLAGGPGGELEIKANVRVPVYPPLSVVGSALFKIGNQDGLFRLTLHPRLGLAAGTGKGDPFLDLTAGNIVESQGNTGRRTIEIAVVGIDRVVRTLDSEPPPLLLDVLSGGLLGPLAAVIGAFDVDVWGPIADAVFRDVPSEVVASMVTGEYFELADEAALRGEFEGGPERLKRGGNIEMAHNARRRWEAENGKLTRRDYSTLDIKFGGKLGPVEGKVECRIPVAGDSPQAGSLKMILAGEFDISPDTAIMLDGVELFASIISDSIAQSGRNDEQVIAAQGVVASMRGMLTNPIVNAIENLPTAALHSIPGVKRAYELEIEIDLSNEAVKVAVFSGETLDQSIRGLGKVGVSRKGRIAEVQSQGSR